MQTSKNQKLITIDEYVKKVNPLLFRLKKNSPHKKITRQAVYYRIANNLELPEVISVVKVSNVFLLNVKFLLDQKE